MKPILFRLRVVCRLVWVALCIAGCSSQPATLHSDSDKAQGAVSKGVVINGERFTTREVVDHQQRDLVVGVVAVPEKWQFKSEVVWNYANISNPVRISTQSENPANAEAAFGYPPELFFYLRPAAGAYRPGQNYGGLIFSFAQPPLQTLVAFIRQVRTNVQNLQFVGSKDLPDLSAALKITPGPNQHGLGVKVTYQLDGKPVEEEFYAVFDSVDIPYDGPQGRTWEIHWGLEGLHSFRAPAGTLDQRRPVFAALAKSFRPNPAWQQRQKGINAYLAAQYNRQLQAGYDAIAAAGRMSHQISENNDNMLASIDRQLQQSSSGSGSGGSGEARSEEDKFDDYVRGVDTVDDPYYGTSQQSSNQQYHWTDGYGSYRNTNDPSYDPNQHENGDWQLMKAVP